MEAGDSPVLDRHAVAYTMFTYMYNIIYLCSLLIGVHIDCPDLMLETKRHVREDDLRTTVSPVNSASDTCTCSIG